MSVSIKRPGCYPCISRILSMSKHMVGGYEGLCLFGVSIHIIPTQLSARLLLSVLVFYWQFPQRDETINLHGWWTSVNETPLVSFHSSCVEQRYWNTVCEIKNVPVIHLYCKMIEQNNSLGTNVPLPSLGMSVIFLSGLWAWFEEGTEQQNVWLCWLTNVLAEPSVVKRITLSSLKEA